MFPHWKINENVFEICCKQYSWLDSIVVFQFLDDESSECLSDGLVSQQQYKFCRNLKFSFYFILYIQINVKIDNVENFDQNSILICFMIFYFNYNIYIDNNSKQFQV